LEKFFTSNPELDWKDIYQEIEKYLFEQQELQIINNSNGKESDNASPILSPFFFYNLFMSRVKLDAKTVDQTFQQYCVQVSYSLITHLLREQFKEEKEASTLLKEFYMDFGGAISILKSLSDGCALNTLADNSLPNEKGYVLSPTCKLSTIAACAKKVIDIIVSKKEQVKQKDTSVQDAVSTDEFLPIFICVVCAAELCDMFSELNFIKSFALEEFLMGEYGFYFSSFESAAYFILNFENEEV